MIHKKNPQLGKLFVYIYVLILRGLEYIPSITLYNSVTRRDIRDPGHETEFRCKGNQDAKECLVELGEKLGLIKGITVLVRGWRMTGSGAQTQDCVFSQKEVWRKAQNESSV